MDKNRVVIFVLSDSIGETAEQVAKAASAQYPECEIRIKWIPYVTEIESIQEVISEAKARHFLEDANAPKEQIEKIVGPQEVLSIICTSVAIEGGDKLSEPLKAGQS